MVQVVNASSGLIGERCTKMSYREPEPQQEDLGTLAAAGLLTVSPGMNARKKPWFSFPGCLLLMGYHCLQTSQVNRAWKCIFKEDKTHAFIVIISDSNSIIRFYLTSFIYTHTTFLLSCKYWFPNIIDIISYLLHITVCLDESQK